MDQNLFLKQEELVQAHQLGELQREYLVPVDKTLAVCGAGMLWGVIYYLLAGGERLYPLSITDALIYLLICTVILGGVLLRYRQLHVYVYTHGLLYLNGNNSQVARWEQISKISRFRGNTYVLLNDGSQIELSIYIWGSGKLRSTLKREVTNYRSSS